MACPGRVSTDLWRAVAILAGAWVVACGSTSGSPVDASADRQDFAGADGQVIVPCDNDEQCREHERSEGRLVGPCRESVCGQEGHCETYVIPDGVPCNDGLACTTGATCLEGECHAIETLDCDDGIPCTSDFCREPDGCVHEVTGAAACDDGNACTEEVCDPFTGCRNPPLNCDDGIPCTADSCETAYGCRHEPGDCSDGNACNGLEVCDPVLGCRAGTPVTCAPVDACHEPGICSPATGTCTQPQRPDGSSCDDGDPCTRVDLCHVGSCEGFDPVICPVEDACHGPGECDTATGQCLWPTLDDGTECDDGSRCTEGDVCLAGTCINSVSLACDDGIPDTIDWCDPSSGCIHSSDRGTCDLPVEITASEGSQTLPVNLSGAGADSTSSLCAASAGSDRVHRFILDRPATFSATLTASGWLGPVLYLKRGGCNDGVEVDCVSGIQGAVLAERLLDAGTYYLIADARSSGAGASTLLVNFQSACRLVDCDDGNPCTGDICDAPSGTCSHATKSDGAPCDTDRCLVGGTCIAGSCLDGHATDCDDGNPDTADRCDARVGCVHEGGGESCIGATLVTPAALGAVAGDSRNAADDLSASCGGAGAPDVVYQFTLDRPTFVTATVVEAEWRHVLSFRHSDCGSGAELGCSRGESGRPAVLAALLPAGPAFLVVDGRAGDDAGTFLVRLDIAACVPDCGHRVCGTDPVCGLSCGECPPEQSCHEGACRADAACEVIGWSGCCQGSRLHWCSGGEARSFDCDGIVAADVQPCGYDASMGRFDCGRKDPLPDGMTGECPWSCAPTSSCEDLGRSCGPHPECPGLTCGACEAGSYCQEGTCAACLDSCGGRVCGPSTCPEVSCGECEPGMICDGGDCVSCTPDCTERHCGMDPLCPVSCGDCPEDSFCAEGTCRHLPSCLFPIAVACGETASGDTSGVPSITNSYGCLGSDETGGEQVYALSPATPVSVRVTLRSSGADLDLVVLDGGCDSNTCLARSATTLEESLAFDAGPGGVSYLIVEGYHGAAGAYDLEIACEPRCVPDCSGVVCGADPVCGTGSCGECEAGTACIQGACAVPACLQHKDCPDGSVCQEYQCIEVACSSQLDCDSSRSLCNAGLAQCAECLAPADCGDEASFACESGRCRLSCIEDPREPDDTIASATPLAAGDLVSGLTLCGAGAQDHFLVRLEALNRYVFDVRSSPDRGATEVLLHRATSPDETVATGVRTSDGWRITHDVGAADAGDYRLVVRGALDGGLIRLYDLSMTSSALSCTVASDCGGIPVCHDGRCVGCGNDLDCPTTGVCQAETCQEDCPPDAWETNHTKETAAVVGPGIHDLVLCQTTRPETWFRVDLVAGQRIDVLLGFVDSRMDINARLEDASGNRLDYSTGYTDQEDLRYTASADGPVFLRVYRYSGTRASCRVSIRIDSECVLDSHCLAGSICADSRCVTGCRQDAQCAAGRVCLRDTCILPGCLVHTDCPVGQACLDYSCLPTRCSAEADCAGLLLHCDPGTGECVPCTTDDHCALDGEVCVSARCVFRCDEDRFEENDSQNAAIPVGLGIHDLAICEPTGTEEDWFAIQVPDRHALRVALDYDRYDADVDLRLYNTSGSSIASSTGSTDHEEVTYAVTSDSTLFVRAYTSGLGSATYRMSSEIVPVDCAGDDHCDPGEICTNRVCVEGCRSDSDCVVAEICRSSRCVVGCRSNTDCPAGEVCLSYACQPGCRSDLECPEAHVCSTNKCLPLPGDTCGTAPVVELPSLVLSDISISEYEADVALVDSACTGFTTSGRDAVYAIPVQEGQKLTVRVTSTFDATIYLLDRCDAPVMPASACLAGVDQTFSSGNENLSFTAPADRTYYLVIDHFGVMGPPGGTFDISLSIQ